MSEKPQTIRGSPSALPVDPRVQPRRAVAAAEHVDHVDARLGQRPLQVGGAVLVDTCEIAVHLAVVRAEDDGVAELLEVVGGLLDLRPDLRRAGRCDDGDRATVGECRWLDSSHLATLTGLEFSDGSPLQRRKGQMRRTTTLGALAAGLALIAAAPASAHHPKPKPVDGQDRSPAASTTRATSRSRRTATSGSPRPARGAPEAQSNSCFNSAEGAGLHGRQRRDHAHQPLGPEARRDRARLVRARDRQQRDRPARHLRRRQRHLLHQRRPDRAVARRR